MDPYRGSLHSGREWLMRCTAAGSNCKARIGVFYIEQFGGRADYPGWFGGGAVPTTGTDNYEPLMTMTRWVKFSPSPFEFSTSGRMSAIIQLGAGRYKFGQTVMPYSTVHIRGIGTDQDPFGYGPLTQLWFVNTTGSAFCFVSNNTGPTEDSGSMPFGNNPGSAYGSILEGLSIHGTWSSATGASMSNTDNTAAVRARCMIECRNVQVNGWRSTGFHIHASIGAGTGYPMEGNANQWRLTNCYVFSCGGHGLLVAGNDANTGYSINFSTHGGGNVRGAGLIDGSALGNTHLQPHIAGYGDRGVHRAGKHYQWMLKVVIPRCSYRGHRVVKIAGITSAMGRCIRSYGRSGLPGPPRIPYLNCHFTFSVQPRFW